MTWYAAQASGTVIDYNEWNSMVSSVCHKGSEYRTLIMPYGISAQKASGGSFKSNTITNRYLVGNSIIGTGVSGVKISGGTIRFKQFVGLTDATAAELELLTNASVTTLHSHPGGGGGGSAFPSGPIGAIQYKSGAREGFGGDINLMYSPTTKIFSITGTAKVDGSLYVRGDNNQYLIYGYATTNKVGLNSDSPQYQLDVSGSIRTTKHYLSQPFYSGQVSGAQLITRLYPKKPSADYHTGEIIRVSGTGLNKTYVYIAVRNDGGTNEWIQLGIST